MPFVAQSSASMQQWMAGLDWQQLTRGTNILIIRQTSIWTWVNLIKNLIIFLKAYRNLQYSVRRGE